MERYLVKLVYRKKPTVKLFFETLEKAVLVFNKKAQLHIQLHRTD